MAIQPSIQGKICMKYASDESDGFLEEAEISDSETGVILTLSERFHAFSVKSHTFGPSTGVCLIGA